MEKSSPFLQQRQGCGAGINPALRRFCRQFNLDFSSSGFTHITPSCTNGVYSPERPRLLCQTLFPHFVPSHTTPVFPSGMSSASGFVGAPSPCFLHGHWISQSIPPPTPNSCGQLQEQEPPSAPSFRSQRSLFPLPAGSASSVFPSPCSPKPLSSLQSRIPVCSGGRTKAVPALESFQMLLHISL